MVRLKCGKCGKVFETDYTLGIVFGPHIGPFKRLTCPACKQVGSVGVFTFMTHQMEGTWHDYWIGVYEEYVYTSANALKLVKQ